MKRCTVTVEGRSITVEAKSLFRAAIAYNAEALGGCGSRPPKLTPESVLSIQAEGEEVIRQVIWRRVLEWANAQPAAAIPPAKRKTRDHDAP